MNSESNRHRDTDELSGPRNSKAFDFENEGWLQHVRHQWAQLQELS